MVKNKTENLKDLFGRLKTGDISNELDTPEKCLDALATAKWSDGYICRNCGNEGYCQGKTPFSRRCTRCKKMESATAHTIFHHCRIVLPKAFEIASLVCSSPGITATKISQLLETRQMTCLNFKKRILGCISAQGDLVVFEPKS